MQVPKIQIALDYSNESEAVAAAKEVGDIVDIIEVGTVLLIEEGSKVISTIRQTFPEKTILADPKCADAGETISKNLAHHGANAMTCISAAEINTILAAKNNINNIQIELFGEWTLERAKLWLKNNIDHVIYHQSRDNEVTWGEEDLSKVKELLNMGFKVSVTGGLSVDALELFQGIAIDTFIVGRGITGADNPVAAARVFKHKVNELWGDK